MIELYQFELSHYCEKIRLVLDYKGLSYQKVEVTPGMEQLDLFRWSGQRQVPVLKDGETIVADSTAIARYLEETYPNLPLLPTEPKAQALCWMLEEWADESIGLKARTAMIGSVNTDLELRRALLPTTLPRFLKDWVGAVPSEVMNLLGLGLGLSGEAVKFAQDGLRQNLGALSTLLSQQPYLLGDTPTLADLAVAGLSMYIQFPPDQYVDLPPGLAGQGVASLIQDPAYAPFWAWRDRLYADYRRPLAPASASAGAAGPTPIAID